jgi:hypothetical protein
MGRNDDAIAKGRHAVELKPESKDAVDGSLMNGFLALIQARAGENDLGIPHLKHRWECDPIRDDPGVKQFIAEAGP